MKNSDELFNVNGLIQSKIKKNISDTVQVAKQLEESKDELRHLSEETDDMLEKLVDISKKLGISTNILEKEESAKKPVKSIDPTIKISIPSNYDFKDAFAKLVLEAQQAGFDRVQIEELLSEKEIQKATDHANLLNEKFERETQLTAKDCIVLMIAASIKIFLYYILHYVKGRKEKKTIQKAESKEGIDAAIPSSFDSLRNLGDLIYTGDEIIGKLSGRGSLMASIRGEQEILMGPVPFDIRDNQLFAASDILGYDPKLGWLIGVLNILTNTVTTKKLESFSVFVTDTGEMQANHKLSTLANVLYPVINEIKDRKESLIAAVVREADVLKVSHSSIDKASEVLATNMTIEQENHDLLSYVPPVVPLNGVDFDDVFKTVATDSFVNILLSAICAVLYDHDKDGDVRRYSIRINKIITISNAIAALGKSIPVLISEDVSKIDFGGIISTLLSLFGSTRFWIEIKTEYLISEYKKEIDKQFDIINQYFEIT